MLNQISREADIEKVEKPLIKALEEAITKDEKTKTISDFKNAIITSQAEELVRKMLSQQISQKD
jgi:hypothetical protein